MSGNMEGVLKALVLVGLLISSGFIIYNKYEEHQARVKKAQILQAEDEDIKKFLQPSGH